MDVKRIEPNEVYTNVPLGQRLVLERDFDRVTAQRDALQQLLNARDEDVENLRTLLGRTLPYLSNTPDLVQHGAEDLADEIRSASAGRPCYGPNEWGTECGQCGKCKADSGSHSAERENQA